MLPAIDLNLLHIEDSAEDALLIRKSLKNTANGLHSYKIKQVETIKAALYELDHNDQYNAILLDLNLPDGQGVKNIEIIKNLKSDIPIIVVTGTIDEETALLSLSQGAQEYVVKSHSSDQTIQQIIQSSIFRKRAEIELSRKAYTDPLTGLPNRNFFEHAAKAKIFSAQRYQRKDIMMFLDLDKFKQINDMLGHESGNIVLKTVANRLKSILRQSDLVARYAGDEFIMYLESGPEPLTEELCLKLAEKIIKEIKKPIKINNNIFEAGASLGIAIYPDAGDDFSSLLKNADKAMYKAKRSKTNKCFIINEKREIKAESKIAKIIPTPVNKNVPEFTILIIDDNKADRLLYKKILHKNELKLRIIEAETAKKALNLLERHTPECIILDYNLPGKSGIEFLSEIAEKEALQQTTVIMVTQNDDKNCIINSVRHGAKDYITKNDIDEENFNKIICNALEKQQLQKKLNDYKLELERSNRELHEFAHTASHDLKAPARKIAIFCEMLQEKLKEINDEEVQSYIDRMLVSTRRMQNLINDLLSYAELNHAKDERVPTSLGDMISTVIDEMDNVIQKRKAIINFEKLPEWPIYQTEIKQLFSNLISNGIKYANKTKPPILNINSTINKNICYISVKDNGIGIDNCYINKIFEPFNRLHNADEIEGTGLGLAICKKIVEKHGGEISVQSTPGEGSTFTVSLSKSG